MKIISQFGFFYMNGVYYLPNSIRYEKIFLSTTGSFTVGNAFIRAKKGQSKTCWTVYC